MLCALVPIPSSALTSDIARDLIFIIYFFAAVFLGHSLARYMPIKYLIYGLFLFLTKVL